MASSKEERLLTLYADVHYYFDNPSPRPLHHRFDKGSYIYLYRDTEISRGRLEVANHAGTPEQDAFSGYLDASKICRSYKRPNLFTITVDAFKDEAAKASEHQWRLPSTDPRDEGKYLFRLHTVDIYFWTLEDAETFQECAQRTLHQEQMEILDAPVVPPPHNEVMSPVVAQLESIAIKDPAYHNGQTRNSRSESIHTTTSPPAREEAQTFTPLAYNPAAPPAPEPIKHREKTPPPPEAAAGTGLVAAALQDEAHGYAPQQAGFVPSAVGPQSLHSLSPQSRYQPSGYGSSPSYPSQTATQAASTPTASYAPRTSSISTFSPPPTHSVGPSAANPYIPQHSSPGPPQCSVASPLGHSMSPMANQFSPSGTPLETPTSHILGNSYIDHPFQPLQHLQPQYADYLASQPPPQQQQHTPTGGYSDYKYNDPQNRHHHHHSQDQDYAIHSQVYRPTEEEADNHHGKKPGKGGSGQQPGKLEQKAEKVEKGLNKFLRKVEKKIG
ncbi:MAG: hypothetical protein MMC33_003601 [Icmadophila ericetorum]|nr:hypothetical protein [Icmadophila ericetorum]